MRLPSYMGTARFIRIDPAAATDREARFFRGMLLAVPAGVAMWALVVGAILWAVKR